MDQAYACTKCPGIPKKALMPMAMISKCVRFFASMQLPVVGFVGAVVLICMAGCSDGGVERVQVSGRVLIDGEPLTTGYIRVYPEGARDSNSNLDSEGRFELRSYNPGDGVPLGTHVVTVSGSELIGTRKIKWNAPPRYAKVSSSGLTLEVTGSTEDAVIELTWGKKGKPFVQK